MAWRGLRPFGSAHALQLGHVEVLARSSFVAFVAYCGFCGILIIILIVAYHNCVAYLVVCKYFVAYVIRSVYNYK